MQRTTWFSKDNLEAVHLSFGVSDFPLSCSSTLDEAAARCSIACYQSEQNSTTVSTCLAAVATSP
jgi:hypothetical protein